MQEVFQEWRAWRSDNKGPFSEAGRAAYDASAS